jgi:hypothetical protein
MWAIRWSTLAQRHALMSFTKRALWIICRPTRAKGLPVPCVGKPMTATAKLPFVDDRVTVVIVVVVEEEEGQRSQRTRRLQVYQ